MAALDALNIQCRTLAARVNDVEKRLASVLDSTHVRLLRIEQALGLMQGPPQARPAQPAAPVVAPAIAAKGQRPGVARAAQPVEPRAAVEQRPIVAPPAAVPAASADTVLSLLGDFLTALQHAGQGTQRAPQASAPANPAIQESPAAAGDSSEDLGWLGAEGESAPPAVDVTTTHVDHP